jgi:DNA-binding response OmpR family regulator
MARILMIDDDQTILDLEKKFLSDEGHDIIVVENALEALDILELYKMDLIILDIEMPRFNGFQFIATIRSNPKLAQTPIAFLSAHSEADTVNKAAKLGADFYLLKPIEKKSFVSKVASFLHSKILEKHPKVEFHTPPLSEIKVHLSAHLIEISDIGVKILIEEDLQMGQIIELVSSELNGVFSENPLLQVSWIRHHEGDLNEVTLLFTNKNIETVRKLQRHLQAKSEVLKYSKAG